MASLRQVIIFFQAVGDGLIDKLLFRFMRRWINPSSLLLTFRSRLIRTYGIAIRLLAVKVVLFVRTAIYIAIVQQGSLLGSPRKTFTLIMKQSLIEVFYLL